jgi:hypothetical protein
VAVAAIEAGEEPPLETSVLGEDPLAAPGSATSFDDMPPDGAPPA